jgi:adenylosuccinate synthase
VDPIPICVGYRLNGKRLDVPPCDSTQWINCEPIYETMPGWKESTRSARKISRLPKLARDYISRISQLTGAKLSIVSVGPTRAETIVV